MDQRWSLSHLQQENNFQNARSLKSLDNCVIQGASVICYLGAWLDQHLSLKKQITTKCATAMFNIQCIKHIWNTLTQFECQTLAQGLAIAHLDYANALYFGLPDTDVKKLQRVQNIAARLILRKTNWNSITGCLRELHWLPMHLCTKLSQELHNSESS